jgi:hypothetical protein
MEAIEPLDPTPEAGAGDSTEPVELAWPWDALRAEQQAEAGTFTHQMRHDLRWDAEAFTRLETAMHAACSALDGQTRIDRWVGEGFWCWTAVIPELTVHPHFSSPEAHYLRRCLARLRDLGSWFFNGTSPYGPDHVWEPVAATLG